MKKYLLQSLFLYFVTTCIIFASNVLLEDDMMDNWKPNGYKDSNCMSYYEEGKGQFWEYEILPIGKRGSFVSISKDFDAIELSEAFVMKINLYSEEVHDNGDWRITIRDSDRSRFLKRIPIGKIKSGWQEISIPSSEFRYLKGGAKKDTPIDVSEVVISISNKKEVSGTVYVKKMEILSEG